MSRPAHDGPLTGGCPLGQEAIEQAYREIQRRDDRAEHRVERLKRKLNLTPDQEKAINAIFQKAHERAARMNEKVAWDLALIHRDSIAAIRPLLTPEQLVKFERLHEKYHGRHPNLPLDSEKQPPPQDSH